MIKTSTHTKNVGIETLHLVANQTRLFGSADIGYTGMGTGWSEPEWGHSWSDGFDATINALVDGMEHNLTLSVEVLPYISENVKKQDVTLYVNGLRAGFWRLTSQERVFLQTQIPALAMQSDEDLLQITFHLPDSVAPSQAGDGDDIRILGLCFYNITLR